MRVHPSGIDGGSVSRMKTIAAFFAATLLAGSLCAEQAVTTVILVRHAEKAGPEGDVPLSDAGVARARELARVLSGAGVTAIVSTPYRRNRETAEPLARLLGLEPVITVTGESYARDVAALIREKHRGGTVVVIGHSNTTPNLLRHLGIADPPGIADSQYDDLFICTIVDGLAPKLTSLRYGPVAR